MTPGTQLAVLYQSKL